MTSDREARRAARRAAAHRRTEPDAAPAGETAIRSKPVRITADLAPELYRRFTTVTASMAEEIDAPKLPLVQVIRAFIAALEHDEAVHARVVEELRNQRS